MEQICTKCPTLIKQPNFGFQISIYTIFDEESCNFKEGKETCSDNNNDDFILLEMKQIFAPGKLVEIN